MIMVSELVEKTASKSTPDLPAICTFCAFGFFLEDDTYFSNEKFRFPGSLQPWMEEFSKFHWYHEPRNITLEQATEEFAALFSQVIDEQTGNRNVILPLSGGLDSRTQAAALKLLGKKVHAFSYRFERGIDETSYAGKVAAECGFEFENWEIPRSYLWGKIMDLARLNNCQTEFTHPRQMAFAGSYQKLGDVFSIGHWGDVLFDSVHVPADLPEVQQVAIILKKFIRKGGDMLAEDLWRSWNLHGTWTDYIKQRISELLSGFPVKNHAGARIRAFKSRHWATRWTAANLTIFANERPVTAPYFDTRICNFICTLPESILSSRKIQVEFLKKYAPQLARVPWQAHRPFNLYNYQLNRVPLNLPYRIVQKAGRTLRMLIGSPHTMRNWELQFTGKENDINLRNHLSGLGSPESFLPVSVVHKYYNAFRSGDRLVHAHPLSMLLTLSVFSSLQKS